MTKNLRFVMWAVFTALTGCLVAYVYSLKWSVLVGEKICEMLIEQGEKIKVISAIEEKPQPVKTVAVVFKKSRKKKVA